MLLPSANITEISLKAQLINLIDSLQSVQFGVIKDTVEVQNSLNGFANLLYTVYNLNQDGSTTSQQSSYNDALFQFITSASSVRNSSLASFIAGTDVESTVKNFYFVNYNGLRTIRWGSEDIAEETFKYYYDRTLTYQYSIFYFMIPALCFLFIAQFILIPFVFGVQRTTTRVLSLFGYIPLKEITYLAVNCERFLRDYIQDHNEKNENSEDSGLETATATQKEQEDDDEDARLNLTNNDSMDKEKKHEKSQIIVSPVEVSRVSDNEPGESRIVSVKDNSSEPMLQLGSKARPQRSVSKFAPENKLKDEEEEKEHVKQGPPELVNEEEEDREPEPQFIDRSQKLLNYRDSNRMRIIFQFSAFAIFTMCYFILDYGLELKYISDIRAAMVHFSDIAQRLANAKYAHVFTQEEIANNANLELTNSITSFIKTRKLIMSLDTNTREYYMNQVYFVEGNITGSLVNSFPSDYTEYFDTLVLMNSNNTCSYYTDSNLKQGIANSGPHLF